MFYNIYMKTLQKNKLLFLILCIFLALAFISPTKLVNAESDFVAPDYFNEQTILTNQVQIAKILVDCSIYSSQSIGSAEYPVNQDSLIIVLESNIIDNEDISFVLFEDNGTQIFGYLTKSKYEVCAFTQLNATFHTFYTGVKLYKYPSINSVVVGTLNTNEQLSPINNCANYSDSFGNNFYAISYENGICYINSNEIASLNEFEPAITETPPSEDKTTQLTAYFVIVICLFLATVFICYKISKKESE